MGQCHWQATKICLPVGGNIMIMNDNKAIHENLLVVH